MTAEKITFGKWLRQRRRALDLTQQALADQIGCARITLRRIENDALKPSRELALILLEKLGIPEEECRQWLPFARGLDDLPPQITKFAVNHLLTNLPAALTSFIGREKEQAALIKLIRKYRLVTLTGSGGVGKTRLSLMVGAQLLPDFPDGVWLAELASTGDPALLPQVVAQVFGITVQINTPLVESLSHFLRPKNTLLILDNCEHLLDASARLADTLLRDCPNLKILTTSREALRITGEAVYHVPSLGVPDMKLVLETFKEYESVRLFEERAQLAQMDFSLTLENVSFVAQICHRLDGIPLPIELAAAHVNTLPLEQIAEQLKECFQLLSGGSRTALPRQQTIRASIDWSWNLLTEAERAFLRRLSAFAGGWTLESAQSVCGNDYMKNDQARELMLQLVQKSLVMADKELGSEARFHFHETIRQYLREKLIESGEEENIRKQHMQYFHLFSGQAESGLIGPQQIEWHARVIDERDNLRAAFAWADKSDVETGLSLTANLGRRFWESFDAREGAYWLDKFLQKAESIAYTSARAKALHVQGGLRYALQQFDLARAAEEESLILFRASGDKQGEIDALLVLGSTMQFLEGMDRRIVIQRQALHLAESIGDKWRKARALAGLAGDTRDLQSSYAYFEDAIDLFRQVGDLHMLASISGALGHSLVMNGQTATAKKWLEDALDLNRRMNNTPGMEFVLTASAYMALLDGHYAQARGYLLEWMKSAEELGNRMGYLWARARLGYVAFREKNLAAAQDILMECMREFRMDRDRTGLIFTAETMVCLFVELNQPDRAARLFGWAEATRKATGDSRPQLEQMDLNRSTSVICRKLGENKFKDMLNEGSAMTLDEAVEVAVGNLAAHY
ncbi:MAG: XRE family transcriptional regulator [Chloroflexi bacterium]|nr:XRE family transcriptional regulator [Chloroflexota bacterium]